MKMALISESIFALEMFCRVIICFTAKVKVRSVPWPNTGATRPHIYMHNIKDQKSVSADVCNGHIKMAVCFVGLGIEKRFHFRKPWI